MTREELLSMAFAAGFSVRGETIRTIHSSGAWVGINDKLAKFAELVAIRAVAAEREACMLVREKLPVPESCTSVERALWDVATLAYSDAISARGSQ